ncbi:hypothetical protein ACFWFQ_18410 [Nocardia salmonicida]|uniref:hypothetical protein n=1 Tax=Nocardia salmonicida TaxID=53431 RepID=UPI00365D8546
MSQGTEMPVESITLRGVAGGLAGWEVDVDEPIRFRSLTLLASGPSSVEHIKFSPPLLVAEVGTVVYPGIGHVPNEDVPAQVTADLVNFWKEPA